MTGPIPKQARQILNRMEAIGVRYVDIRFPSGDRVQEATYIPAEALEEYKMLNAQLYAVAKTTKEEGD